MTGKSVAGRPLLPIKAAIALGGIGSTPDGSWSDRDLSLHWKGTDVAKNRVLIDLTALDSLRSHFTKAAKCPRPIDRQLLTPFPSLGLCILAGKDHC